MREGVAPAARAAAVADSFKKSRREDCAAVGGIDCKWSAGADAAGGWSGFWPVAFIPAFVSQAAWSLKTYSTGKAFATSRRNYLMDLRPGVVVIAAPLVLSVSSVP